MKRQELINIIKLELSTLSYIEYHKVLDNGIGFGIYIITKFKKQSCNYHHIPEGRLAYEI